MHPPRRPLLRRLIPWILTGTFVVLAVLSIARILSLREQLIEGARRQAEERLQDQVNAWEEQLLERLSTALRSAAEQADTPRQVQEQLRQQTRWVESIVLWEPAERTSLTGPPGRPKPPRMIFPLPHNTGDSLLRTRHPCMNVARILQFTGKASPVTVGRAYLEGCRGAGVAVRLEASIEASSAFERAGLLGMALAALDDTGLDPDMTLSEGVALGLPADRLIVHRGRRAELLMSSGREEASLNVYYETGQELAELDAPDAQGLETYRWNLLEELSTHGRRMLHQRLEIALQGLDRRIRAWREVQTQLAPEVASVTSTEPRLIRDQYVDRPYLLYYGVVERSSGQRIGVALQLDQQQVLNDFLRSSTRSRGELVITDAAGSWVLGARRPSHDVAVQVPFTRTLSHLRVGVYDDSLARQVETMRDQWVIPLIVTGVLLVIGFFALSSQLAAERRLSDLLFRQREFTTRVTHELKTPIAGIKVMAENLELGTFKGRAAQEQAARRIVEEADRLTQRIDEVLAATRERSVPEPQAFDIEDLIYELIDLWGPRMEQHGIVLEADLDEAPELFGDPEAVRDAIGCLLDNALKYRNPDADPSQVWLTLSGDERFAVVEVADNGLGVPVASRKRIFDRFVRVEGPHRGLSGGHGLGLAQVASTAKAHHGTVTCTDGVDGGARFTLRLRAR